MLHVVAGTDAMRECMHVADHRIRKRKTGIVRSQQHLLSMFEVRSIVIGCFEVLEDEVDSLLGITTRSRRAKPIRIGFDRMGQSIHTRVGSHGRRKVNEQLGIEHCHIGNERKVGNGEFALTLDIGHDSS